MNSNKRATHSLLGLGAAMMLVLAACAPAAPAAPSAPAAEQPAAATEAPAAEAPAATEAPAAAPAAGEPVTIRVSMWESQEALEPYNKAKEAFEKANPNIKVQLESVPQNYGTKLLTQIAAGTAPDVFQLGDGDVANTVQKGIIENLDPYIQRDKLDTSMFFEGVFKVGQIDGKTYLLTKDYSPLVLYYNKDLFEKAGVEPPAGEWTWDDLVATAQKLTVKDGDTVTQWGLQAPNNWNDPLWVRGIEPFVYQNGGKFINDDNKTVTGALNSPQNVEAIQFYVDLFRKNGVAPDTQAMAGATDPDLFKQGKAAMLMTGRWPLGDYQKIDGFNFGTLPLPKSTQAANAICWAGFGMNNQSQNKDAAWEWLKFVGAGDGAKEFANYALTAVRPIAEAQGLVNDPVNAPIMAGLDLVVPPPSIRNIKWADCEKFFKDNLEQVFLGNMEVKAALDDAATKMDECLAAP